MITIIMCHSLQFDAYHSCYNNKQRSNICLGTRSVKPGEAEIVCHAFYTVLFLCCFILTLGSV